MQSRMAIVPLTSLVLAGCMAGRAGDAVIRDNGPGFGTRYDVQLPSVDLGASGTHSFTIARLPREHMELELRVPLDRLAAIQQAKPKVTLRLTDRAGGVLKDVTGTLEQDWMHGDGEVLFYQTGFLSPTGAAPYRLEIHIDAKTPGTSIPATPRLRGGGLGTL
jgi:hypothetical protein